MKENEGNLLHPQGKGELRNIPQAVKGILRKSLNLTLLMPSLAFSLAALILIIGNLIVIRPPAKGYIILINRKIELKCSMIISKQFRDSS